MNKHKLLILGTRGIPNRNGELETFAERLALYLTQRGWRVTVYCQGKEDRLTYSIWRGINLVHIPVPKSNSFWSVLFDLKAAHHAARQEGLILTLGYNTAAFSLLYRLKNRVNMTNMNGMEWLKGKWNALEKSWLYANERCAALFSNYLIAEHPEIEHYLRTEVRTNKPISVIPSAAEAVTEADETLLEQYNLVPQKYSLLNAMPEPENSILEIVSAFSQRKRNMNLVVTGRYMPHKNDYHRQVLESASDEVMFVGKIRDREVLKSLQYYNSLYLHGHQMGGNKTSLIEAMSASNPILAHDNYFNSWVVGNNAVYFKDAVDCDVKLTQLLEDKQKLQTMSRNSLAQYYAKFADDKDLKAHEELFLSLVDRNYFLLDKEDKSQKAKSLVESSK